MKVIKRDERSQQQQQSKMFWDVLKKHLAIFGEHYRQPISELSVMAYAEDLVNLTPEQLDAACVKARQTSEFMPVSAAILRSHNELEAERQSAVDRSQYLGPALEWDPKLEQERLDRKAEWERQLASGEVKPSPEPEPAKRKLFAATRHAKSLEQQKQELRARGWINDNVH